MSAAHIDSLRRALIDALVNPVMHSSAALVAEGEREQLRSALINTLVEPVLEDLARLRRAETAPLRAV